MAKKQSTRPNLLGIQKQMLDAGRDTRAESFMKGAMGAFALNIAETEKQEAMMEKHMEDLGGIENIVKLPIEQRGQVEDFLRTNRDEYSNLAAQYQKSKDPAIKDKMNAIKYKFQTLDTELSKFAASKAEYMSDYEEGNLMKGGSFAKDNSFYMGMYGDPKTQFSIGETGEMSFTVNGETKAFKDVGSHTLRNYEAEKNIDTLFGTAADLKVSGKSFDKNRITNNFVNGHKGISRNDLQAILQTDLTGDGDKPSFMDQWASGGLGDEFYNGVDKNNITEEDVKTLLKDKQRGLDLMGKYVGNISQGIYDDGELDETIALTRKAKQAQINASNRANKNKNDNTSSNNVFKKTFEIEDDVFIQPNERQIIRESVFDDEPFDGYYGNYKYNEETDSYDMYDKSGELVKEDISKLDVLTKEGGRKPGDPSRFRTASINKKDRKGLKSGEISVNSAFVTGDDDASAGKINNFFKLESSDYKFVPYYSQDPIDRVIAFADHGIAKDAASTNDIMLIGPDGKVAVDKNNKPIVISTDSDDPESERNKINEAMLQYGLLDDFEEQEGEQTDPLEI